MGEDKRRDPRVPSELRIKLAYDSIDEFVDGHALNVSRGGIFVRTLDLKPPGTPVTLRIELQNGEKVIAGKGVVRWTSPPPAPGEPLRSPSGMGVKFTELDAESEALIEVMVATAGKNSSDEPPRPAPPPEEFEIDLEQPDRPPPAPEKASPEEPPPALASSKPEPPPAAAPAATPAKSAGTEKPKSAGTDKPKGSLIVGIDLGTTNSCVALAHGGKAEVLASKQGYRTLPSVVAYDAQGKLLVGHPAKAQMIINPRNTVYGAKRLVGRPFASPTVQACRDRFHYEIVEGDGGAAAVRFAGRTYSLQQISAFVLQEMREMASQVLGEEVQRAVVTVPAYYNDHQRQAVREAGLLAGLHVERIVNEPTAAALAFGYGRGLDKKVLVYDLGGGTFDASVLEIQGDVYEVLSTGGDTFLGGVDFDSQLLDHLVYAFMQEHGFPPPEDRVVWQRIRDAAEETKIALSERESAVAHVPYLCKGPDGKDRELKVEVTRAELEALTVQLIERSLEVCREVLAAKGLDKKAIGEVLLVGGQSRMPLVWKKIREEFGREPNKSVHPDEAVALGAALLADSESRIDSVVLIDVLAMGIGVGLPGGRMATVLPRNTKLPAKKSHEIATTHDGQKELEVAVFQGDSPKVSECEYLGTIRVHNLRPAPRGSVRVSVEFALGNEGILDVTARDLGSGSVTEVKLATVDTPASLREKLQIPEPQTTPKGARPIEPDRRGQAEHKGVFGRLFGGKR